MGLKLSIDNEGNSSLNTVATSCGCCCSTAFDEVVVAVLGVDRLPVRSSNFGQFISFLLKGAELLSISGVTVAERLVIIGAER